MVAFTLGRRSLLLLLLGLLSWLPGRLGAEDAKSLTLTVNFADGCEKRYSGLAWREGITVADLVAAAAEHPRGIRYETRGKGETAFLLSIDQLANGTNDKYWIYEVNGTAGETSYGVAKLAPGDAVLWRFGTYP